MQRGARHTAVVHRGKSESTLYTACEWQRRLTAPARTSSALVTGAGRAACHDGRSARPSPAPRGLPDRGSFTWRGQRVGPSLIRDTALLTNGGAQDDMCSAGQTEAAHQLCTGIAQERRRHHLQQGVGHYGVLAGSTWERESYPVVRGFMADSRARELAAVP